jgi:hypothetical protein
MIAIERLIRKLSHTHGIFALSQRVDISLFFYSPRHGRSRIPAAEKQPLADNFLQKQQNQRDP